jgi:hypothetical protein
MLFLLSRPKVGIEFQEGQVSSQISWYLAKYIGSVVILIKITVLLSDSYPAFFLPIATTSNKNF